MKGSTFVLPASKSEVVTGLQVVILGDVEVSTPWTDEPTLLPRPPYWNEDKQASDTVSSEKLRNLLMAICLEYPFWNDFRIVDFFNKRGIVMTTEELRELRSECGIESKEDVCLELMRRALNHEIELDKKQVQFIERLNPAFRDRDFTANRPGDLLIYECIFLRRLNKMFYLHLVFDLFNGYAFGRVSRRCTGEIGLKLLQEKIIPFYHSRGYKINTIVHSIKSTRDYRQAEEASIRDSVVTLGINWLEPKHEFGIIQRFQRDFLECFFSKAEALDASLPMIQPAFDRWMIKYNSACSFHQRRNYFGYTECGEAANTHFEAKCN